MGTSSSSRDNDLEPCHTAEPVVTVHANCDAAPRVTAAQRATATALVAMQGHAPKATERVFVGTSRTSFSNLAVGQNPSNLDA